MGHIVLGAIASDQVNLVFHEGDEGGNDDGATFADDGGQLVAKAFAPTCGHDHKGIITGQQVFNNGSLVAFKLGKSEMFLQGAVQIYEGSGLYFGF